MPFPWPSFGDFYFLQTSGEVPVTNSDSRWKPAPIFAVQNALGNISASVTLLGMGSQEREFDILLTPARLREFMAFIGQMALFTDWGYPGIDEVPDSRNAVLMGVVPRGDPVWVHCPNGSMEVRQAASISLLSQ